ncbi:hypothetical protein [Amycolatopsis sp. NPDC051716]
MHLPYVYRGTRKLLGAIGGVVLILAFGTLWFALMVWSTAVSP